MRLSQKQQRFTIMVANLILNAQCKGMAVTFGETYRTKEQQALHVKNGLSRVKHSKHQDRLAVDMNLFIDGKYISDKEKYRVLGEDWERMGGRWGGRFGVDPADFETKIGWDAGHFEYGEA